MTKVFVADARRRWSDEEKQAIIEESKNAPVARVAKKHGVAASLLFRWRKQQGICVRKRSLRTSGVLACAVADKPEERFISVVTPINASQLGRVEVVLAFGAKLLVDDGTDFALLKRIVAALS